MSFHHHRKPSRSAPRPPRPALPRGADRRSRTDGSSPNHSAGSSTSSLEMLSNSYQALPQYSEVSRSPGTRRGSDGALPEQIPPSRSKRQTHSMRSKSTRQRKRPEITIVSASPMSQHPAFADGSKGSYIPPEAPPSYDEAVKTASASTSPYAELALPDSTSHVRSTTQSTDFEVRCCLRSENIEEETQPEVSSTASSVGSTVAIVRQVPAEHFSVALPSEIELLQDHCHSSPSVSFSHNLSHSSSSTNSPCTPANNSQSFYILNEERQPVPTPRSTRKVSRLRAATVNSSSPSAPSHQKPPTKARSSVKPAVPPKRFNLGESSDSDITPNRVVQPPTCLLEEDSYVNIEETPSPPRTGSLLDDFSNTGLRLPAPMKPSSNTKLPPPSRPPTAPKKTTSVSGVQPQSVEANVGVIATEKYQAHQPDTDAGLDSKSLNAVSGGGDCTASASGGEVQQAEPVYALVQKKQSLCNKSSSQHEELLSFKEPLAELHEPTKTDCASVDQNLLPPPIPATRPPLEDYEDILLMKEEGSDVSGNRVIKDSMGSDVFAGSNNKPQPKPRRHKTREEPSEDTAITEQTDSNCDVDSEMSLRGRDDPLYESVQFRKGETNGQDGNVAKAPTSTAHLPRQSDSTKPPPLPTSRPVGPGPTRASASKTGAPVARVDMTPNSDVPKREKSPNSSATGLNVIRRKSIQFKEKGLKIFRQRASSEESDKPKPVANSQSSANPLPHVAGHERKRVVAVSNKPLLTKPKRAPPPRPALPAVLQRKLSSLDMSSGVASDERPDDFAKEPETQVAQSVSPVVPAGVTTSLRDASLPSKPSRPPPARPPAVKSSSKSLPPDFDKPLIELSSERIDEHLVPAQLRQSPVMGDVIDYQASDLPQKPLASIISTPVKPKPKPARPPPAMLSTPPIALAKLKHIPPSDASVEDKPPIPDIDEQMKQYAKAEQFYVAVVDYHPTNFTDISFLCGEKVSVMKTIDDATYFGRNEEGDEGTFPKEYVRLESEFTNDYSSNAKLLAVENNVNANNNRHCVPLQKVVAHFDYTSEESDDLCFSVGEIIDVIEVVSEEWLKGRIADRTGIFPKSCVVPLTAKPVPNPRITKTALNNLTDHSYRADRLPATAVALHSFTGRDNSELSFHANDVIFITKKINSDWFEGKLNGNVGRFPANFVEVT